jgi:hypothetical protein
MQARLPIFKHLCAMEIEDRPREETETVEIYSKRAILGFSIFFSPIFGGILLVSNLKKAGYKAGANVVLAFSIMYTLLSFIIVTFVSPGTRMLNIFINVVGGLILSEYFFKNYFPDDDYYPKSIKKPLIISLLITIPFVIATIYALQHAPVTK